MRYMKRILAGSFVFFLSALICPTACERTSDPRTAEPVPTSLPNKPGEASRVTLATSKNLWCTLALVADQKGFFHEQGLDVDVEYQAAGRYCLDAVISGSSNFGTIVEVNIAYHGFSGNENLAVVGTIVSSTSSAIIGRKSAGIASPADLKSKRLGLSPGTTSDIFAHRFLKKNGLSAADLDIRKIQPLALQDAMANKGIDLASTWEPFVHNIRVLLGEDAIVFTAPEAYVGYENLAVRRDWATQHPSEVRAFLRALKRAEAFVASDPDAAQQLVAKAINLDLQIVSAIWKDFDMRLFLDKVDLVEAIKAEGDSIRQTEEAFLGKSLPEYAVFVDDTFIKGID